MSIIYECEGQMTLTDYLKSIAPPDYCEDCVFLEGCKCGLGIDCKGEKSLNHADGWERIFHHKNNTVSGKFPECMEWQEVETFHVQRVTGEYFFWQGFGKDKGFKWPKDQAHYLEPELTIAWRYKRENAL